MGVICLLNSVLHSCGLDVHTTACAWCSHVALWKKRLLVTLTKCYRHIRYSFGNKQEWVFIKAPVKFFFGRNRDPSEQSREKLDVSKKLSKQSKKNPDNLETVQKMQKLFRLPPKYHLKVN